MVIFDYNFSFGYADPFVILITIHSPLPQLYFIVTILHRTEVQTISAYRIARHTFAILQFNIIDQIYNL